MAQVALTASLPLQSTIHGLWDAWVVSIDPWTYRVKYFADDGQTRRLYDGRRIRFNNTVDLPAPPQRLRYEHFKQAVLANMKGAGEPRDLDFDPTEDAQTMSVFESGHGKEWLETTLADRLAPYEGNAVPLGDTDPCI